MKQPEKKVSVKRPARGPSRSSLAPAPSPTPTQAQAGARTRARPRTRATIPTPAALPVGRLKAELLPALGAAALATAVAVWVLQLWKASLHVPFVIGAGDSLFGLVMVKDVLTHGWDLTNPSLGMPFGQELYDYPAFSGDSFYMAIVKVLGTFIGDPAVTVNVYYLLGFPLVSITSFAVLRRVGVSIGVAVVCAVLYATLPFHLDTNETHIFLSTYFIVPVCCWLVLAAFRGSELFTRDERHVGLRAYLTKRSAAIAVVCLVVGSGDNYFALYTVALMAPAAILAFFATRRRRPLVCGAVAMAIVLGAVVLNGLPTVVYDAEHGPNTVPTTRIPRETDIWGLSLANLVMPIESSRIPALAKLAFHYNSTVPVPASSPTSEPSWTNIGIVATLGLLWLAIVVGIRCVRGEGGGPSDPRELHAAMGAGMAFLIGTVGGLSTVFAYVVDPQLHAPARIVVFIAFFALLGAALGLDRLRGGVEARRRGRVAWPAVLAGVLVVGVLYQTSPEMAPEYAPEIKQYNIRTKFVRAIEAQVPSEASIFELPYVPFPQGKDPGTIGAYEDLYSYFVSNHLRWSGGAMEGRPTNWVPAFTTRPLPQILEGISAIGFAGLYFDREGLSDPQAVVAALSSQLGVAPVKSAEGRFTFFNMALFNRRFHEQHSAAELASIAASALYPQAKKAPA